MSGVYRFIDVPLTKYPIARHAEGRTRTNRGKRLLQIMAECIEAGGSVNMVVDTNDRHIELASGSFNWNKKLRAVK